MKTNIATTLNEYLNNMPKKVYIISSDGHRDSAELNYCAIDEAGLKKLLIEDCLIIGNHVIEDSIKIDYEKHKITFDYHDNIDEDYIEQGTFGFLTLIVV